MLSKTVLKLGKWLPEGLGTFGSFAFGGCLTNRLLRPISFLNSADTSRGTAKAFCWSLDSQVGHGSFFRPGNWLRKLIFPGRLMCI